MVYCCSYVINFLFATPTGIYAGDGKVIHLARGPDDHVSSSRRPSPSHSSDTGGVVLCSTVEDFLSGGSEQLYGFEYGANIIHFLVKFGRVTCTLANSDPPGDVLHRASSLLDISMREDVGPNICSNSSELFAVYCKTGSLLNDSGDIDRGCEPLWSLTMAIAVISLIPRRFLPTTFTGLALVVCGFYCFLRISGHVGNGLSEKVAVEKFDPSSYPRVQRDNMDIVDRRRRARAILQNRVFSLIFLPTIWYWTPQYTILLWIRQCCGSLELYIFLSKELEHHGFKPGDSGEIILFLASFAIQFVKLRIISFWIIKSIVLYFVRSYI